MPVEKPAQLAVSICVPAFGYAVSAGARRACAQAIAREVHVAADELRDRPVDRVEVRHVCCLADRDLEHIFAELLRSFDVSKAYRVADIAPEQLSNGLMTTLRNFHVDLYRLDVGSLNPSEFHALGRGYDLGVYGLVDRLLKTYGMRNWSALIDLGIKGQTGRTFLDCLDRLTAMGPGMIEVRIRDVHAIGVEAACDLLSRLDDALVNRGYAQAAPLKYVSPTLRGEMPVHDGEILPEVWGFGPGAFSFIGDCVLRGEPSCARYIETVAGDQAQPVQSAVKLDAPSLALLAVREGLRSPNGIDVVAFAERFGAAGQELLAGFLRRGEVLVESGRARLTPHGTVLLGGFLGDAAPLMAGAFTSLST